MVQRLLACRLSGAVVIQRFFWRLISNHLGSPILAVNVADTTDVPFKATYDTFGTVTAVGATELDWMPFGSAGGMYDLDTKLVSFGRGITTRRWGGGRRRIRRDSQVA